MAQGEGTPRLGVERLEDRVTPVTITWQNPAGGSWQAAANWNLGRAPAAGDDVVIPALSGAAVVNFTSGATAVQTLTAAGALTLAGGRLSVAAPIRASGAFTLAGGTLAYSALAAGTTLTLTPAGGTLTGVSVAAGGTIDGTQAATDPLAYYSFDGGPGDGTGHGYDAVPSPNPPALVTTGYQGSAYRFDDALNNYLTAPIDIGTAAMPRLTMGGWFNATAADFTLRGLLSADAGGFDRTMEIDTRNGGVRWSAFAGYGPVSGPPVVPGQWTFVAVRYDQTTETLTLDVDGTRVTAPTDFDGFSTNTLTIGRNPNFDTPFDGLIDGVFVYDRLLTDAEIYGLRVGAYVTVTDGLHLDGVARLGAPNGGPAAQLIFDGSQPLAGTGTVLLGASGGNALLARGDNGANPATLTIESTVVVRGGGGTVGGFYAGDSARPLGSVSATTAGSAVRLGGPATLVEYGPLAAANGDTVQVPRSLRVDGTAVVTLTPDSTLAVGGDLLGTTRNPGAFRPRGTVLFNGAGTAAAPQRFEAMSADLGPGSAAFTNNFALGSLVVGANTVVRLVNSADNAPGAGAEAVYTNALVVPAGSTLDLNGLRLYARAVLVAGTVTGGTVTQVPDTGPITLNTPTPGRITTPGQLDEWTFYGRAGGAMYVTLDPGSDRAGGPVAPALASARVQLLDAAGTVLATATTGFDGQFLSLNNVRLPADGVYRLRVQAAPAQAGATGNYVLTAWDLTPDTRPLTVNQRATGTLATPFSTTKWTFAAAANTQVRFDLLGASAVGLTFALTGPNGFVGFAGLVGDSGLVTLPAAGTYTLTVTGSGGATGNYTFQVVQTTLTPLALGGTYAGTFAGSGHAQLFAIAVPSARVLTLKLADAATADRVEVYASLGTPPTRAAYDYRFESPGSNQSILVPSAAAGTWYVLVYADRTTAAAPFTLSAAGATSVLTESTPARAGNAGPLTLTLTGAGFTAGTTVALVAANGTTVAPIRFTIDGFTRITATFPAGLLAGTYSVRATTDGDAATLADAFTLVAGGVPNFTAELVLPQALGRHAVATIYVRYANTGDIALPAPMLVLSNRFNDRPLLTLDQSRVVEGFWTSAVPDGFSTSISILASGATPGVLHPGESVEVPVYYAGLQQPWDFGRNQVPLELSIVGAADSVAVDWASLKDALRPAWVSAEAWEPVFAAVVARAGSTAGGYVRMLDDNAAALGRLGESVTDVGRLWNFSVRLADGVTPVPTLAAATDVGMVAPGVPLSFGRSFGSTITSRHQTGAFGRGWSVPWQTSLAELPDGTVVVVTDGGAGFRYQPDDRPGGRYFAADGDLNTLAAGPGGTFRWTQADGTVTTFRADGRLDAVRDANGNTVTASYAAGRLVGLTHSSGASLAIAYNAAGRIGSITDSAGRQAVYTYDAANEHLLSVQTPAGVTSYTYSVGNGAATEHALTSVTFPDGTHRYFGYDALGRLAGTSRDGNAEAVAYTYGDPGEVVVTDAVGNASRVFYDQRGLPVRTRDAFGNVTSVAYDPATLAVSRVTDPTGQTTRYTYDARGNLTSRTDALGHTTRFTYGEFDRLASLTDAAGTTTNYLHDESGNLLATEYANGTTELATFDPLGNPLSFTNRRDQAVSYTSNAAGQVTRQTLPDGSHADLAYDARGNLRTATDAAGTTTFGYDAADRLTRVDYPGGAFLQFTLDAAGRRMRMTDQTGYAVVYAYDAAGRLSGLRDAGNALVVTYTYDPAGRLSRKDNANGTFTTYDYDAAGRVLHLVNRAPGGAVSSRFDSTYDALGRRATTATLDGTWTYTYDGVGRLTRAVFASTNGAVPNQDLTYTYDARGNRTSTVVNGVTTAYTPNDLNQYTSVGGVAQTYDADGNLLADGTNTYTYDVFGRVTSTTTAVGTTTYTYDALGNRSSRTTGGQTTRFVSDPTDPANVFGEFNAAGAAVAHNAFGLGLATRVGGGSTYYYDFDATGSTAAVTGPTGAAVNTYSYTPFGGRDSSGGGVPNPFTYGGQYGVGDSGGGTYSTGSSQFRSTTGDFLSRGVKDGLSIITSFGAWAASLSVEKLIREAEAIHPSLVVIAERHARYVDFTGKALGAFGIISDVIDAFDPNERDGFALGLDAASLLAAGLKYGGVGLVIDAISFDYTLIKAVVEHQADIMEWGYKHPLLGDVLLRVPLLADTIDVLGNFFRDVGRELGNLVSAVAGAFDPNDKIAPGGYGAGNFVLPTGPFPYRIDFENDRTATAPAQTVTVTDQLSPFLDWDSFRLTELGFGDTVLAVPPGSQYFQTTVPMALDGKSFDVLVEAGIDTATGRVFARFQSVDPLTELPPDVLTGFVPPENDTGRGQGHVSYTVRPKPNLPTGTQIRNVALITFDVNAPISTDQADPHDPGRGIDPSKQALVTIDVDPPVGSVNPLPPVSTTAAFPVSWGAADGAGSGGASYDVFVSDDGGPFRPWLVGTPLTTATYPAQDGHTYRFYVVATDGVGLRELGAGGIAEATTTVRVPVGPSPPASTPELVGFPQFGVGADRGGAPVVRYFNPDGSSRFDPTVFDGTADGGVRTAAADFNGDHIADLVVGTGPGVATFVRILDGVTQAEMFAVAPFEAAFTGGVYVAAGDLTGDGIADLVITPDEGGGPRVVVYRGGDFLRVANFFGIDDPNFRGGARAAVGDLDGDGRADLVVAAGFGGGPRVAAFSGRSVGDGLPPEKLFNDLFVFEQALRNGAFIAVGDLDGDGRGELIAGGGPGGGPRVLALSGADLLAGRSDGSRPVANFFAGNVENRGGIRVAVKDLDGDRFADLVVGDGAGGGSRVTGYYGKDFGGGGAPEAFGFDAFPGLTAGVFVG
ncbi:MAG: LamG-like jellyroll fold domain-containing protein [Gemmataceae bacterium]